MLLRKVEVEVKQTFQTQTSFRFTPHAPMHTLPKAAHSCQ